MTPDEIMKMEGIAPELRKVLAEMVSGTASLDARVTALEEAAAPGSEGRLMRDEARRKGNAA